MYRMRYVPAGFAAVALFAVIGCGRASDLEKVEVRGTVTYAGTPIKNGEIRFQPTGNTRGPVSGAFIADGEYRVQAKGGVPVGTHIVKIDAFELTSSSSSAEMTESRGGTRVNIIPPKYNRESVLQVDITGESSRLTKDFNLDK